MFLKNRYMPNIPIDQFLFFLFIIPGAITVWSFRFFRKSKKTGDFEYLALSVFWGVVMLSILMFLVPVETKRLIENPYASVLVFSFFGFCASFVVHKITVFIKGS